MTITLNGENQSFEAPLSLYDVLEQEGYIEMMIAVAQNGTFVARTHYKDTPVKDGDALDIVAPMQGG